MSIDIKYCNCKQYDRRFNSGIHLLFFRITHLLLAPNSPLSIIGHGLLKSSTTSNLNIHRSIPTLGSQSLHLPYNIKTLSDFTKYSMLAIEPRRISCTYEELTSIRIGAWKMRVLQFMKRSDSNFC